MYELWPRQIQTDIHLTKIVTDMSHFTESGLAYAAAGANAAAGVSTLALPVHLYWIAKKCSRYREFTV